jgi:uncharacterized protein YhdP
MKLPAFSDEGLVFDKIAGDFAMERGRVKVRKFELDSISYAMSASGELNFREDTSNVRSR